MARKKQEVRDAYLSELPEDLRVKILDIHKLIVNAARTEFAEEKWDYLSSQDWAKTMLDEFLVEPGAKTEVGSVRLFKRGRRFKCMIQITAHIPNDRDEEDEEFFHGFLRNVHVAVRAKVRRQFDMSLTCESEHGEPYEGFDLWTKQKQARELWNHFEDKEIKTIDESTQFMVLSLNELPPGLQRTITETASSLSTALADKGLSFNEDTNDIGYTVLKSKPNDIYEGSVILTPDVSTITEETTAICEDVWANIHDDFDQANPSKVLNLCEGNQLYFEIGLHPDYAGMLWKYMEGTDEEPYVEHVTDNDEWDPFTESEDYNVDMDEKDTKRTLRTLSSQIISEGKPVSQYTANIYANLITKNLLPVWAKGYQKLVIQVDPKTDSLLEFKIPKMTTEFVARFIQGHESINGLLHRDPVIKIRMSENVFHTMKQPDDGYNFFRSAVKYYNSGLNVYAEKVHAAISKLPREMKRLISTTKLSGLVTAPIQMGLTFNNVDMSSKQTFKIKPEDIKAVTNFINGLYSKYESPEKEKSKILTDLNDVIQALKESCSMDDNLMKSSLLVEGVTKFYNHDYDGQMKSDRLNFIHEAVDQSWNNKNADVKYLQEKFGVKKLKKIPYDIVSYLEIEKDAIQDSTDKMMLASYAMGKIELVEWYIELLETDNKRYIVPHSLPYLKNLRNQLIQCYKNIMAVKIKPKQQPTTYTGPAGIPKGYEG